MNIEESTMVLKMSGIETSSFFENVRIKSAVNMMLWALLGSGHLQDASHQGDVISLCDVPFLNAFARK